MPRVLALYAGRAATLATATGIVPTAIAKSPVRGRVRVDAGGLPGDEQVYHSHGGAKVAARLGIPDLVMRARRARATGLHLRVLEPGELAAGDAIAVVERAAHGVTVADAVAARFDPAPDASLVAAVLALPELAEEWRVKTSPRLAQAA